MKWSSRTGRGRMTIRPTGAHRRPARAHAPGALIVLVFLTSACASGSSDAAPGSLTTGGVQVRTTLGARGAFDVTTEAAVIDSLVPAPITRVWSVLPSVFDAMEIEAPVVDRASLLMGNPGFRAGSRIASQRLSTYLDCGSGFGGPNADRYDVTLQLGVQLRPAAEGHTRVTTLVDAYASPRDVRGNEIHCTSKGTIERLVFALTTERLGVR